MKQPGLVGLFLVLALMVSAGVAISLGSVSIPLADVVLVLRHRLIPTDGSVPDPTVVAIVWSHRLPRILLALLVGGGLSVVGVGMQALVRNPLAEPYILGISSGASAGASLFYMGLLPAVLAPTLTMPIAAFAGGLLAITLVYLVAHESAGISVTRLLLAGVAVSALMAAVTSFITLASPDIGRVRAVLFWLLGSLNHARWDVLAAPAIVTSLGFGIMMVLARPLDALLLGEEPARGLGVPVETVKRVLIVLSALVTGSLVAVSGIIGFVGLIVPHVVRMYAGVVHRRLIPLSFLGGAIFLIWADLAARTLLPGQEAPVGVVTALCGVPFFLVLLRRRSYRFA
jgi:iron complex transport system permease protein